MSVINDNFQMIPIVLRKIEKIIPHYKKIHDKVWSISNRILIKARSHYGIETKMI
jgi:hypothetical protein